MTRREFVQGALAATAAAATPLTIPLHRVTDAAGQYTPEQLRRFWREIWPEAVRDFARGGMRFESTDGPGRILRSPGGRPIFYGLQRGVLNLVLTDHLPSDWDSGRALAGVTAQYNGYHLCLIALRYAHGHQIPFLAVNTCVHEVLHALLLDLYAPRPKWFEAAGREARIDTYATRLWLLHDGAAIRRSAQLYLNRLRAPQPRIQELAPFRGNALDFDAGAGRR